MASLTQAFERLYADQGLIHLAEASSTNRFALDFPSAELRHRLTWIVADKQTQGRGRSGAWETGQGNLSVSLLFESEIKPADLPQLGFVAGVALAEAVIAGLSEALAQKIRLKWPNDLLFDHGKVAGILSESKPMKGKQRIAIGWGVNCSSHPEGLPDRATNFAGLGQAMQRDALLLRLVGRFEAWLEIWERGGFSPVRKRWEHLGLKIGEPIDVEIEGKTEKAVIQGLADDGALILIREGSDRIESLRAGEIRLSRKG